MSTENMETMLLNLHNSSHMFSSPSPHSGLRTNRRSTSASKSPAMNPYPHYTSAYQREAMTTLSTGFPPTPSLTAENWPFAPDPNNPGHWTTVPHDEQQSEGTTAQASDWQPQLFQFGNPLRIFPEQLPPYSQADNHYYPPVEVNDYPTPWTTNSSNVSQATTSPPIPADDGMRRPEETLMMNTPYLDPQPVLSSQAYHEASTYEHQITHSGNAVRPKLKQVQSKTRTPTLPQTKLAQFRCRFCSEQFSKRSNWADHEKTHDSTRNKVKCPLCNKCYGRAADLARHNRSHHKLDRHSCRFCHKTFNRSDICRRHESDSCRKRGKSEPTIGKCRRKTNQRSS